VTALFSGDTPVEPLTRVLSLLPGVDRPQQVSFRYFEDQPWERAWLDRFKPMQFGSGLWIVPGDGPAPAKAVHVLRLDPGLAFGTGTHPTTHLCLEWVGQHDFEGQKVVDYGCGSGVLGIAAAIKGASAVVCIDNDPQALMATRDNANRNGVLHIVDNMAPEQFDSHSADVLLANILAGPLIELAPRLRSALRPGGALVLSGILEAQAEELTEAYSTGFSNLQMETMEGWVLLTGRKLD
jgi:ribosomal protein L11 methyltransferase